jgi:hypothetical protein
VLQIYKQINRDRVKQEISAVNYALYSIHKAGNLQGELDNPLPYEEKYATLITTAFQQEFKRYLEQLINSGLFQTTFDISYWPQSEDIEKMTAFLVDLLTRPFDVEYARQFRPEVEKLVTELYTSSVIVGGQMANVLDPNDFSFDLVDREAIDQLDNIGVFWVSEGARKIIITDSVTSLAKEAIGFGMGLAAAGELFRNELMGVVAGKSEIYYNNLASIVMNRARNVARINTFYRLGITTCEWLAIPDARICAICEHLDGTTWRVEHLKQVVDNLVSATTPEEVIESTPFINSIQNNEFVLNSGARVDMNANTEALARLGVMPPIHGGCRCQIIAYTS